MSASMRGTNGTDLSVTTGAGSSVTGGTLGIYARNYGSGALTVTADGDVTGTNGTGINARNFNGTDLGVTTGAGTTVTGGSNGIVARNSGSWRSDRHRQWRCHRHQLHRHLCAEL